MAGVGVTEIVQAYIWKGGEPPYIQPGTADVVEGHVVDRVPNQSQFQDRSCFGSQRDVRWWPPTELIWLMIVKVRFDRPAEPRRTWRTAMALWLVYGLAILGVAMLCKDANGSAALYLGNGAIIAGLLVLPRRTAIAFCIGCLCLNFIQNAVTGVVLRDNLLLSSLNQGLSLSIAVFSRLFCGAAVDLSRFRRLATFAGICFICAGVEAVIGQTVYAFMSGDHTYTLRALVQWGGEDALGALIATPATLLTVKRHRAVYASNAGWVERVVLIALSGALALLAFSQAHSLALVMIFSASSAHRLPRRTSCGGRLGADDQLHRGSPLGARTWADHRAGRTNAVPRAVHDSDLCGGCLHLCGPGHQCPRGATADR